MGQRVHILITPSWSFSFDLVTDKPQRNILWEKLPGFPLELWTQKAITYIANSIGKFYYLDESILGGIVKNAAWVLIEISLSGGLPTEIDLYWGPCSRKQIVNYWSIPF